ncbi:MAG: sialidase family protein [Vicinamibacterales bacterium]
MPRRLAPGLLALAVTAACGGDAPAPAPPVPALAVTDVASPATGMTGEPRLTVSPRGVLLSWVETRGDRASLQFAERAAGAWTPAREAAAGGDWFVNWADVPSVLRLSNGHLAAHWLQKSGAGTYAYDVRLAWSGDDGATWSPSMTPHHDDTESEHGFASLYETADGGLGLVWLDGRGMTGAEGHEAHGGDTGAMSVRAATYDTAWQQTSESAIDLRVCECCPTAVAVTADGPIAAFRNRSDDEVRDIHVSRLAGGVWSEPVPVHEDGWRIPACPVNGPALSADGRAVAIAWFTVKDDQGQAFAAFSADAGRTFSAPIRLDDAGALGRVGIDLLPGGRALATWIEFADGRAQFRARLVDPTGARGEAVTIAGIEGSRASGYPRVARHGDEIVFAWTATVDGTSSVQTAVAMLPR